ncbi:MAG: hypothetical protein QOJ99_3996 [Bryobacterales bacterium]|jgi:hypothetical protein|nr:hypothetical protein [Bryobacterales bacterium]
MSPATPLSQISEAQLEANRQNAQKSTGPKTEEGKKRCRINATRHGLTGQFHAFSHEDKRAFDEHCTNLMADFNPETYREKLLAMSIAEDTWRLNRARALENNIFAIGMSGPIGDATDVDSAEGHAAACQARVWLADGRNIQLLAVYETRIRRNIEKNEKQLRELQTERKAAHAKALYEEILLARLAISEGIPYECATDPGQSATGDTTSGRNGFAFSTDQIIRLARRELRLHKAKRAA